MAELRFARSALGPIIGATLSPAKVGLEAVTERPVRHRCDVSLLIDTGAERSVIDETLIDGWGLVYVSASWAATINGTRPIRSFELALSLGHASAPLRIDSLIVMARRSPFHGVPYRGLLGRDVLDRVLFEYDGPHHRCRLSY